MTPTRQKMMANERNLKNVECKKGNELDGIN